MTTFVFCRGCAHQIHETATTCPKCGAPQAAVSEPAVATKVSPPNLGSSEIVSYSQVPWFRKRWFAILSILIFMPVYLIIAYTGDVYYEKKGELKVFPKSTRIVFTVLFILWILKQAIK